MSLNEWSTTPNSNQSVGSINWTEGQLPGTVNGSARQMMADVAEVRSGGAVISGWHMRDSGALFHQAADSTAKFWFSGENVSPGVTRKFIVPNFDGTLATLAGTETLTNKTLTAPTINNPTLNVDTIGESSAGAGVTVDGVKLKDGSIADLSGGQIKFPATQAASADVNTLDDYEEGTWTPTITFATPGDLSVAYTTQAGFYTKIGRLVIVNFIISTSAFTHTTASGALNITGLPITSNTTGGMIGMGGLWWTGITKAGYTNVVARVASNAALMTLNASGSAQGVDTINAADMPTGGTVVLQGTITYFSA